MSFDIKLLYVWLVLFIVFFVWRILTHPLNRIHRAAMGGDIETVKQCLDKGVAPDTRKGEGLTPLCLSAAKGHKEIVELLLDYGADANQGLDEEDGMNPLLEAALKEQTEVVETLVNRGAVVGLHFSAYQGDLTTVREQLQQGAAINSMRNRGMTPLHLAALGGHVEVVKFLLNQGADVNAYAYLSETPLHIAIRQHQRDIIQLLIESGADLNRSGRLGSPLCIAVRENAEDLVQLLIDSGADVVGRENKKPPLHLAVKKGSVNIARLLLENGAEVNLRSRWGNIPLDYLAQHDLDMADLLVSYGANANAKN